MIKMDSIIKKGFENSQFYKNYNNINNVLLQFKNIKSKYQQFKVNFKNKLKRIKNNCNYKKSKKYVHEDQYYINSCQIILNKKINISHNIKNYIKYAKI